MTKKKTVYLIGNAHIDPVWLWRWPEGFAEIKATFRSALDRMNEYPDFVFTSACAAYYKWVEENAPDMFAEIQGRVREGRWAVAGGMWIQPDLNIPSGEGFARHILYSQRYFAQKFGLTAAVGYNVDSFGHSGNLPQILKKGGMNSYVFLRPDKIENPQIPGPTFVWEGTDGSRVTAFRIPSGYNSSWDRPSAEVPAIVRKADAAAELADGQGLDQGMEFYGVGNHGGGPTRANIETIHTLQRQDKPYTVSMSSPQGFFEALAPGGPLPVWKDDLQHHASGCYSTASQIKANNRRAEHRAASAEKWTTLAHLWAGQPYDAAEIFAAWEPVLFNHFHDVICGCTIESAYRDALEAYGESLHRSAKVENAALQRISWSIDTSRGRPVFRNKEKDWQVWEDQDGGTPVVVFNSLPWEVTAPVQINKLVAGVADHADQAVAVQKVRGQQTNGADKWNSLFLATVPALGYRVYWMFRDKALPAPGGEAPVSAGALENEHLRVEFDAGTGFIRRLYDKRTHTEVLGGPGAVPVVIDIEHCDTWAHRVFRFDREVGRFADASLSVIEDGPVRATVRVTSHYNQSTLRQDFSLCRGAAQVEVRVKLDWREKHKMLKLSFPVNVESPKVTYDIPFGHIVRPANGEEEPGQQWVDVTGSKPAVRGLALLNDSKYSYDVLGCDLRLTVVNSSIFADHYAHVGGFRDELCEFMDQGVQEFRYALLPHDGPWQEAATVRKANELNVPLTAVVETFHEGPLPQMKTGLGVSAPNVIVTALKKSEDGAGYVVRCYETDGVPCEAELALPSLDRRWTATFLAGEIKTFFVSALANQPVAEVSLMET